MWDIYGEPLERGHCEVHPWVHEEYPCPVCIGEHKSRKQQEQEYAKHCEEQAAAYYAEIEADYANSMDGAGI